MPVRHDDPKTKQERIAALLRAVESWTRVVTLNRLRGATSLVDDEQRVIARIVATIGILRGSKYAGAITDNFIARRSNLSASEFVYAVEQELGGKLGDANIDTRTPAQAKKRKTKATGVEPVTFEPVNGTIQGRRRR